ncbi:MAG TPA: dihydroorotase [Candidatus Atribacteria bacterium]|nr:dihydroorotase [Candidatus Atribacteria bacterium]
MKKILIKKGTVVFPQRGVLQDADILVEDGLVARVGKGIEDTQACPVNASNLLVGPGFINLHVHLREPGRETEENLWSGSRAAARGGFTSVVSMPNTHPPIDNPLLVRYLLFRAKEIGLINIFPAGAITVGLEGKEMAEYGLLKEAGIIALSDDGRGVQDARLLYLAFQYAQYFHLPFILHEEDEGLSRGGEVSEGKVSALLGKRAIPRVAEESLMARDLVLAFRTGARVHFTHLSTALQVELLRWFQKKMPVSADVTPHHLLLTEEDVLQWGSEAKVKPPLRSLEDQKALKEGVKEGVISILASDHAPHPPEDKSLSFSEAPFGISNLEIAVPLYVKALIEEGIINWVELWEKLSYNPALFLGLNNKGILEEGKDADITIVDPGTRKKVKVSDFESRGKNCPFENWSLLGWRLYTIVGGRMVMAEGSIVEDEFC